MCAYIKPDFEVESNSIYENEIDLFKELFRDNEYKRCIIIGNPGVGKTKLIEELNKECEQNQKTGIKVSLKDKNIADKLEKKCKDDVDTYYLLDALDEVSVGNIAQIESQLSKLCEKTNHGKIIITCRKSFLDRASKIKDEFKIVTIKPLRKEQISEYLEEKLTRKDNISQEEFEEKVGYIINKFFSCLCIPRYLEYAANLINNSGIDKVSSMSKSLLFDKIINEKLEIEENRSEVSRYSNEIKKRILSKVALLMQIFRRNTITVDELLTIMDDVNSGLSTYFLSIDNLNSLFNNSILTVQNGIIEFENLEFQEYLAAEEIRRLGISNQIFMELAVNHNLGDIYPNWYNTMVFVIERDFILLEQLINYKENTIKSDYLISSIVNIDKRIIEKECFGSNIFWYTLKYYKKWDMAMPNHIAESISAYIDSSIEKELIKYMTGKITENNKRIIFVISKILKYAIISKGYKINERWFLSFKDIMSSKHSDVQKIIAEIYIESDKYEEFKKIIYDNLSTKADICTYVNLMELCFLKYPDDELSQELLQHKILTNPLDLFNLFDLSIEEFHIVNLLKAINNKYNTRKIIMQLEVLYILADNIRGLANPNSATLMDELESLLSNVIFKDDYDIVYSSNINILIEFCMLYRNKAISRFIKKINKKSKPITYREKQILYSIELLKNNKSSANEKVGQEWVQNQSIIESNGHDINRNIELDLKGYLEQKDKNDKSYIFGYIINKPGALNYIKNNSEIISVIKDDIDYWCNIFDKDEIKIFADEWKGNRRNYHIEGPAVRIFGDVLRVAEKLNINVTKHRSKLIMYLPCAHGKNLESLMNLLGKLTKDEVEEFLELYTNERDDDYTRLSPYNFRRVISENNITECDHILKRFITDNKVQITERISCLVELSKVYKNKVFYVNLFNRIGNSELQMLEKINEILIKDYKDNEAVQWRIKEIKKRKVKVVKKQVFKEGFHSVSDIEHELLTKHFAKPLIDINDPSFAQYFYSLIDESFKVTKEDFDRYNVYMQEIVFSYFRNLLEYKESQYLKELENYCYIKHHGKRLYNNISHQITNLKNDYLRVGDHPMNIIQCINSYNELRKRLYLNIPTSDFLAGYLARIIDNELRVWVEQEGAYKFIEASKRQQENMIQKTIQSKFEAILFQNGFRKYNILRELQTLDDKRPDFLVSYGFLQPVLIELKRVSNTEVSNEAKRKEYKEKLLKYVSSHECHKIVYVLFSTKANDRYNDLLHKVKEEYSKEDRIIVKGLQCVPESADKYNIDKEMIICMFKENSSSIKCKNIAAELGITSSIASHILQRMRSEGILNYESSKKEWCLA